MSVRKRALTVSSIKDVLDDAPNPDPTTALEITNWDVEEQKAKVRSALQDINERKKYGTCIFGLVVLWLVAMVTVLVFQGFSFRAFTLSDTVLVAVVTTTTGGVVGLLALVVKYLFPSKARVYG
jgi:hypothetical protein